MRIIKQIYFIATLVAGVFWASSCSEDDSTINEIELNEFNVEGISENYSVLTGMDVLEINPTINNNLDRNFKYYWYYFDPSAIRGTQKYDTISRELNLNYPVSLKPNTYTLIFCAEDEQTGVKDFVETKLTVETSLSRGWYVLKHKDNTSELDLFNTTGMVSDMFFKANGRTLQGKPKQLGWMDNYSWSNPETNLLERNIKTLALLSEDDFSMVRIEDTKELNQMKGMFVDEYTGPVKPNFFAVGGGVFYLGNNSKVYSLSADGMDSGKFGYERTIDYDYELSDQILISHRNNGPIVYDKKQHTMYWIYGRGTDLRPFGTGIYPTENMESDPIYMGYQLAGRSTGKGYMLLKNRENSNVVHLAELDMMAAFQYGRTPQPLIVDQQLIAETSGIISANKFALNKESDLLYFGKDNVLSFYNIQNQTEEAIYNFPGGEKIDFIENVVNDDNYRVDPDPLDFKKLVVATSNGGNYKVYLFDLQAGKPVGNPQVMEGEGTVGDVLYVSPNHFRYEYKN